MRCLPESVNVHPNTYLKNFWQLDLRPQIFVAMSFAPQYQRRFEEVIAPAICEIRVNGVALKPIRVDLSKSGDSILTEINDGIAHSRMVLADVSSVGRDAVSGHPFRNGNVMYEVGIALASRLPHEVLLIRDDEDRFLFDVSTIPHKRIDFTNPENARIELSEELRSRLREANHVNDARVQIALAGLSGGEIQVLKEFAKAGPTGAKGWTEEGNVTGMVTIPRLLDKSLIRVVGVFDIGCPAYQLTPLGYVVAQLASSGLQQVESAPSSPAAGSDA
jgi:hypothetical protein